MEVHKDNFLWRDETVLTTFTESPGVNEREHISGNCTGVNGIRVTWLENVHMNVEVFPNRLFLGDEMRFNYNSIIGDHKDDWKDVQIEQSNMIFHVQVLYDNNHDPTIYIHTYTLVSVSTPNVWLGVVDDASLSEVSSPS